MTTEVHVQCATALEGIDENDPAVQTLLTEMAEGYWDGLALDSPPPSTNRSMSYRHGFDNGRDDRAASPRATAAELRLMAVEAIRGDLDAGLGADLVSPAPTPLSVRFRPALKSF